MTQPNPHSTAADASSSALVQNASRLGLTWDLRPGTIVTLTPTLTVLMDGDDEVVKATSLIPDLKIGARVYVLIIPPGGLFITGTTQASTVYTARQLLVSTQTQVTFSGIPRNLRELELGYCARGDTSAQAVQIRIRLNNIGANYFTEITQGSGAATASALLDNAATSAFVGNISAATAAGGVFGSGKVWFQSLDQATAHLTCWTFNNGAIVNAGIVEVGHGTVSTSGAAVEELDIIASAGGFIAGSDFYLRGTYS